MKRIEHKWSLTIIIGIVAMLLVTSILLQFKTVEESENADIEGLRDTELKSKNKRIHNISNNINRINYINQLRIPKI